MKATKDDHLKRSDSKSDKDKGKSPKVKRKYDRSWNLGRYFHPTLPFSLQACTSWTKKSEQENDYEFATFHLFCARRNAQHVVSSVISNTVPELFLLLFGGRGGAGYKIINKYGDYHSSFMGSWFCRAPLSLSEPLTTSQGWYKIIAHNADWLILVEKRLNMVAKPSG